MSFGLFHRELRQFKYLDISIDSTGIRCCSEKNSMQQEIPLKWIGEAKFLKGVKLAVSHPKQHEIFDTD